MEMKGLIKVVALLFAGFFSLSVNAVTLTGDIYTGGTNPSGVYLGNDGDANEFMADTGLSDITELFRDNNFCDIVDPSCSTPNGVFAGTVVKIEFLDYLTVKFDGVYGVYDVSAYAVGTELDWATADFAAGCGIVGGNNCGAATSHVDGYGVVPVPAAVWLFASGLLGLVGVARKRA